MSDLARRPGPSVRVRVTEHRSDGATRHREDRLVTEEPLEIRFASPGLPAERAWVTMRTPGHDFELAAGWAVGEGLLLRDDLAGVAYCTDESLTREQEFNVVTLTSSTVPRRPLSPGHSHLGQGTSACGVCGTDRIEDVLDVAPGRRWSGALPSPATVLGLPDRLRERQPLFDRTGGVHAAAAATAEGELLVVREDVGRHNAVDKVVGARALAGEDPAAAALVVSGRAGFELVQKAVVAGFGCLVAVGAPSSLAVDLARRSGLLVYGFTGHGRTVQYA